MKRIVIYTLLALLIVSCSPKLGREFYQNQNDILFEHSCNLLPNGYNLGMASANYPGVLAIVNDNLIFDTQGSGSRPWMGKINAFVIEKESILKVELSDAKAFKRKIITISTKNMKNYYFYMTDADTIYNLILGWFKK